MVREGVQSWAEHFEEPLFVIGIMGFALSILRPMIGGSLSTPIVIFLLFLGLGSLYFIYLYFNAGKKRYSFLGIPILIFLLAWFSWQSIHTGGLNTVHLSALSMTFGIALLFYTLYLHNILKPSVAAIGIIFFSALLIHMVPAYTIPQSGFGWTGKYLAALDPYFHYRHAKTIVKTGYIIERETMVYPGDPTDFSATRRMTAVLMGSSGTILSTIGVSVHDIAMVYPAIFSALTVLVLYLLIRDLFVDMKPYNYLAALLAAFMLIFSPAFATKAIASNCEDDALGMFLLVASFMLFTISFRRRSFIFSILTGFSFLLLGITWSGFSYAITVFGIFAVFYSIVNFIHRRNCLEHIPYYVIPMVIAQLYSLLLHERGALPQFDLGYTFLVPFTGVILSSVLLELIRSRFYGRIEIQGQRLEDKVDKVLQRGILPLSIVILLIGVSFFVLVMNPSNVIDFVLNIIKGAKVRGIIGMTTAEQNPLCGELNFSCMGRFYSNFGISTWFGLGMIPILFYFILKRKNLGSVFVLAWALPMVWGVANKSQYQFVSSVPIIALGSTIGLILIMKRKDMEGLRIIPTFLVITLPLLLPFMGQGLDNTPIFSVFGGTRPMLMGPSSDRIYWDPTLRWIGQQPEDTIILTWWDYGHWITAVSDRMSILDNLKGRPYMVQDIARFHVLIENEEEALEIARRYNSTHVVIDWTMIGKSGAPHFIATSNITAPYDDPNREGEYMAYSQCGFSPQNSILRPQLMSNDKGGLESVRQIVFTCGIPGPYQEYIGAIIFIIKDDRISEVKVYPIIRREGGLAFDEPISWDSWRKEHKASILGVHSLRAVLGNAINYADNRGQYATFPTFNTLIYVPEKFNQYMMSKLYLGDYLEEYQQYGLADPSIEKLEHFSLIEKFRGDKDDLSTWGYVRVYKIDYPENMTLGE